MMLVLMLRS